MSTKRCDAVSNSETARRNGGGGGESSGEADLMMDKRRGCCSWIAGFRSTSVASRSWQRIEPGTDEVGGGWWWNKGLSALKKVREWSEMVAGPRWKNYIRRLGRKVKRGGSARFHYDAFSYARNFDDGNWQDEDFERIGSPRFSSARQPSPQPAPAKHLKGAG